MIGHNSASGVDRSLGGFEWRVRVSNSLFRFRLSGKLDWRKAGVLREASGMRISLTSGAPSQHPAGINELSTVRRYPRSGAE